MNIHMNTFNIYASIPNNTLTMLTIPLWLVIMTKYFWLFIILENIYKCMWQTYIAVMITSWYIQMFFQCRNSTLSSSVCRLTLSSPLPSTGIRNRTWKMREERAEKGNKRQANALANIHVYTNICLITILYVFFFAFYEISIVVLLWIIKYYTNLY